jgi:hypothetical protein
MLILGQQRVPRVLSGIHSLRSSPERIVVQELERRDMAGVHLVQLKGLLLDRRLAVELVASMASKTALFRVNH